MKILFIVIATGKYYDLFIENLYESLNKHMKFDFDFLCFTDNTSTANFEKVHMEHLKWPLSTLMRYEYINKHKNKLLKYDYCFYMDSDMLVVNDINIDELISDSVGVIHPGFFNVSPDNYTYDRNKNSTAYIPLGKGKTYYQGCFQGGSSLFFTNMCEKLYKNIKKDLKRNIIALYHDESHLNKYFYKNPPTKELSPDYCFPKSHFNEKKYINYSAENIKIIHLEKENEIRN